MQDPDIELVRACKRGNAEAFREIVEKYKKKVYATCFKLVGNHWDADDVSQDVFLRVFIGLKKFKGKSTFSTWLYRVAVSQSIDFIKNRERAIGFENLEFIEKDTGTRVEKSEAQEIVEKVIADLPQHHKIVAEMYFKEGLPPKIIAQKIKCPEGTVRFRLFKIRKKLQENLEGFIKNR